MHFGDCMMKASQISMATSPCPKVFSEIRIENTNRCGYHCFFCPRDKMLRSQGTMSLDDLELVIRRVGRHGGIVDLHGFGEPLLDSDLIRKVELVSSAWPDAASRLFSTLGVPVAEDYFLNLARAGLGRVEVSYYGLTEETYRDIHGVSSRQVADENLLRLCSAKQEYPNLEIVIRTFPTHTQIRSPDTDSHREAFYRWLREHGVTLARARALHNYGAGRNYNQAGQEGPCSIVWGCRRRILQVTWDLSVIPCCFDFDAAVRFGNLRCHTLEEVFSSTAYLRFVQAHLEDRLSDYAPCVGCERCYQP